jgi:hypothetical protein
MRYVTTAWRVVAERLYGKAVPDNTHVGAGATAGLVGRWPGVDQLSIGPYLDGDRYDHNLGQTTFGHGGYFSPRLFLRSGIYADLLTSEMRAFMIKARVAVGAAHKETDFTPFLPLSPDGREFAAEKQTDFDYSAEILAGLALGSHLQLGGAFSLRRSRVQSVEVGAGGPVNTGTDYNDIAGLVVLRGSWEGRRYLVSRDLPSAAFSDLYTTTGWP